MTYNLRKTFIRKTCGNCGNVYDHFEGFGACPACGRKNIRP